MALTGLHAFDNCCNGEAPGYGRQPEHLESKALECTSLASSRCASQLKHLKITPLQTSPICAVGRCAKVVLLCNNFIKRTAKTSRFY